MRSVIAIVVGYLIFALSAALLFQLTGQQPHEAADPAVMLSSVAVGVVFAIVGGYVAGRIAPRHPRRHAAVVGLLIAVGAIISLVMSGSGTSSWSQVAAVMFMAPAAVAAGALIKQK
jgi:MFS family permease